MKSKIETERHPLEKFPTQAGQVVNGVLLPELDKRHVEDIRSDILQ